MSHAVEPSHDKTERTPPQPTPQNSQTGAAPERVEGGEESAASGDAGGAANGAPGSVPTRGDFLSVADAPMREHVLARMQQQQGNRFVQRVVSQQVSRKQLAVQRETPPPAGAATPTATPAPGAAQTPSGQPATATGLIVDDATPDVSTQQMKRSAFVAQLRTAVYSAADAAVSNSPLSALFRPQINTELEKQFATYGGMDASTLEKTIKAQVPGAAGASSAAALIPLISAQVQQTISERLPKSDPASSLSNAAASVLDTVASGIGSAVNAIGGILFKANEGGARAGADPLAVQRELGEGQTLEPTVRSPMEAAFGQDFSAVRVHTDGKAATLADSFNARAFTVGNTIAFGAGEYRPGSPVGDALVAHELAHVAQQRGAGSASLNPMGPSETNALEEDADRSAIGVVGSLWGGVGSIAQNAVPSLRAGLRLQRCDKSAPAPDLTPAPTTPTVTPPPPPKPLFEQFQTGPERQKAVDDAVGKLGGQVDTSLLEGGRFNYNGAVPGGDGNTFPPNDKTLTARKKPNKKPYVEIYGGAFASTWGVLMSTIYHEFQHVKQMTKGQKTIVPGVHGNAHAQEVEAYASEIIAAEEHGLDADYVKDPLWRRLNEHYNKTKGPAKAQVTPIYNQAKAAYEKITAGK